MTSVFTLLELPTTSNGFSKKSSTAVDAAGDGSASPLRKVARLDADPDVASASRSKAIPSAAHGAIKRIKINGNFAQRPQLIDDGSRFLKQSIECLLNRTSPDLPECYEDVYNRCRQIVCVLGKGEGVHDILKIALERCIRELSREILAKESGIEWIRLLSEICEWFHDAVSILQSVLTYLDQVFFPSIKAVTSIQSLAFTTFNAGIFGHPHIADRLRENFNLWAIEERNSGQQHPLRQDMSNMLKHLTAHGQYSAFENFFVSSTREYYMHKSSELAEHFKTKPQGFFKRAHQLIQAEVERSKSVFPLASWNIIRQTTEQALLDERLAWLAKETVGPYMDAKDLDSLTLMYQVFSRVDGVKVLCTAFGAHIQTTVAGIVKDVDNDDNMVQRLLEFKALGESVINAAFADDDVAASTATTSTPGPKRPNQDFVYALTDTFGSGFKARRSKPAEMLAKYLDRLMRKGQSGASDAAFESHLDAVLSLYRFSNDKDVFRAFYHRQLAKRLLLNRSASNDFEAVMLKKLKENYDAEFGLAEDMFKDLALSREMMREYHSKLSEDDNGRMLTVMVLQRSAWPFSALRKTVSLPVEMQKRLEAYTVFYNLKHSNRRLDWDHALGTVTLKARFTPGIKELSVSLYQAIVLLLFNNSVEIPFADVAALTQMDDEELRRTLQSLACGKKRVLKKSPPGKDVNNNDVFRFNEDFTDPRFQVHINSIQAKVTNEESKQTNEAIESDRRFTLEAAIVRVMKAKKKMHYEQLKVATIDAVKNHFVPQVDAIKKRVDYLVEAEYLERSEEDRNVFRYLA